MATIEGLRRDLDDALLRIAQLEDRLRQREAETMSRAQAARAARIGRSAARAGVGTQEWVRRCNKAGRDPEFFLDKNLAAPRYGKRSKRKGKA